MKKAILIVVLGLLLSGNANAEEKKHKSTSKHIRDNVSKMTLAEIIQKTPISSLTEITSNNSGVQYHFFVNWDDVDGIVPIVCFVNSKSTTCRVP